MDVICQYACGSANFRRWFETALLHIEWPLSMMLLRVKTHSLHITIDNFFSNYTVLRWQTQIVLRKPNIARHCQTCTDHPGSMTFLCLRILEHLETSCKSLTVNTLSSRQVFKCQIPEPHQPHIRSSQAHSQQPVQRKALSPAAGTANTWRNDHDSQARFMCWCFFWHVLSNSRPSCGTTNILVTKNKYDEKRLVARMWGTRDLAWVSEKTHAITDLSSTQVF